MPADDAPEVTITNYVRAESDFQMRGYIEQMDCFGRLVHSRALRGGFSHSSRQDLVDLVLLPGR